MRRKGNWLNKLKKEQPDNPRSDGNEQVQTSSQPSYVTNMAAVSAQTHQVTLTSHSNPSFASTQDEVFFSLDTLFRPFDYIEITASAE